MVDYLCEGLPKINTDWSQWRFFFCDERIVPFTNSESTYGVYKDNLMTKIPVSENQFVIVNPTLSGMQSLFFFLFFFYDMFLL